MSGGIWQGARGAPPINRIAVAGKVWILYIFVMLFDFAKNMHVKWYLTRVYVMVRFYFACQVVLDKSIWAYINRINGNWFDGRIETANRFYGSTALPQTSVCDLLFGGCGASTWQFKLMLNCFAVSMRKLICCSAGTVQALGDLN